MDHPLDELLHKRLLRVPEYQRGYAWESLQLEEFWEDLQVLPDDRDHYTGTVVLLDHGRSEQVDDDRGRAYTPADIVDGQQRLTTITLLLREIERRLRDHDEPAQADTIRDEYISYPKDGATRPRTKLGRDIDDFWRRAILELDGPAPLQRRPRLQSEVRLLEAKQFFSERLDELLSDAAEPVLALNRVRRKVTQRLRFTLYEVDSDAQVGVIFETLNDRGKPLTELEKVKNYLLFLASGLEDGHGATLADRVNSAWSDIYQLLMSANITNPRDEDRFLRAHWLMVHDPIRRNWDGTNSIKERYSRRDYWNPDGDPDEVLADLTDYVDSLAQSAKAFCDIRRPDRDDAFGEFPSKLRDEIRAESRRLARLGALATVTPLLISVRMRFRDDAELYLQVAQLCERFAFRVYAAMEARADTGQGRLFRLAHDTYHGRVSQHEIIDGVREAIARWCPKARFEREMAADTEQRNWYGWSGLRYFLFEYEEHLTGPKRAVKKSWEEVTAADREQTIEHVLPQTPREGDWKEFDEEDRRQLTHDLGNLVLTFDNSHYSNKSFKAKRDCPEGSPAEATGEAPRCYARSPLIQESRLAEFDVWTPEVVRKRHADLAAWALRRWHVEGDEQPPARDDPDEEPVGGDEL